MSPVGEDACCERQKQVATAFENQREAAVLEAELAGETEPRVDLERAGGKALKHRGRQPGRGGELKGEPHQVRRASEPAHRFLVLKGFVSGHTTS